VKINRAGFSHPGKVLSTNQDGLFLDGKIITEGNFTSPTITSFEIQNDHGLFAGGHNAGKVVCKAILTELRGSAEQLGQLVLVSESELKKVILLMPSTISTLILFCFSDIIIAPRW
jgi:hypothetical protein